jgi:hypothetical protein
MMSDSTKENQLVRDVFSEVVTNDLRHDSLAAMVTYSRRRQRQRRVVTTLCGSVVLAVFIGLLLVESKAPDQKGMMSPTIASALKPRVVTGIPIKVLSDEDLFALFPERSLGVVDDRDGCQLVFLDRRDGASVPPISDGGP